MGQNAGPVKTVLDTNTVLSAILFRRGRLGWLQECWATRRCLPLVSRETTEELIRALAYPKFDLQADEIEVALGAYLPYAELVTIRETGRALPSCRDPEDQKFLVLAACGDAEVLVTGDRALLDLDGQAPFAIERPALFKRRFP